MSHLVDDLLDVSRITEGKVALRCARVDLAVLLRLAADEVMPAIQARGQTLTMHIDAAPIWLDADQTRITQIAANLLNNATKYSPIGAHVSLRAWQEAQVACFDVTDNGIGIPPEQLSAIFGMFSQLNPLLEGSTGGLGIGLALVKGLVDLHNGTITARSDGPGAGSCFSVRLPVAPAPEFVAPNSASPARPGHSTDAPRTLAVIDDNADAADTLAMALEFFDYAVKVAYTGASGFDLLAATRPLIAVMDVGLPDMSGYQLAQQVRAQPWGRELILIAATGWGQDSDKQAAMAAGFDAHFTKPVDFARLDDEIDRLIQARVNLSGAIA